MDGDTMNEIIIYHGSENIIEKPEYGKGKSYNDYGRGFYCTEYIDLAKEWACDEKHGGYANKYSLNSSKGRSSVLFMSLFSTNSFTSWYVTILNTPFYSPSTSSSVFSTKVREIDFPSNEASSSAILICSPSTSTVIFSTLMIPSI